MIMLSKSMISLLLGLGLVGTNPLIPKVTAQTYGKKQIAAVKVDHKAWTVLDHRQAAEFCVQILGMEEIIIPDQTLAKGRSWVKFPDSDIQFHFIGLDKALGNEHLRQDYDYINQLDQDMSVFTAFMDNHISLRVDDLTPYLERLVTNDIDFFGPILRDDGFYQTYLAIPGYVYVELISETLDNSQGLFTVKTWEQVNFGD